MNAAAMVGRVRPRLPVMLVLSAVLTGAVTLAVVAMHGRDAQLSEALTQGAKLAADQSLDQARRAIAQLAIMKRDRDIARETLSRERNVAAAEAKKKLQASLSWRLTRPLRFAGRFFWRAAGSRNE